MGGEIKVKTELGNGSSFEFMIPVETNLPLNTSHPSLYSELKEVSTHELEQSATDHFKLEELTVMPYSWIQQFYDSSSQCNERLLHPLIDQIPTELSNQANLLKELVHEFRYDLLLEISNYLLAAKS
jgi:hypothetical protein